MNFFRVQTPNRINKCKDGNMDFGVVSVLVPFLRDHVSFKQATRVCMTNKNMSSLWREECHHGVWKMRKKGAFEGSDITVQYRNMKCVMCKRDDGHLFLWVPPSPHQPRRVTRHACRFCGYRWNMLVKP